MDKVDNSQANKTGQVTIYSAPWCAFCKVEKQYLDRLGVSYEVLDIEADDKVMQALIDKTGARSVPVTDVAGTIVRGFDRAGLDLALRSAGLIA